MTESSLDYLRRRAGEEKQRAEQCTEPRVAAIHARLAVLYADRVAVMTDNPEFDPIIQTRIVRD
ncbi:hypothetical protein [Sphingomonas sp.]|uniref:hypothetical protein n=1 Tax=Sphingomonas sp. TaxID=28214 RepID=UPI00286ADB18|nr:hypothetical protein [Sphingomonas sp.]